MLRMTRSGSESVIRWCLLNVRIALETGSRSALLRCRKRAKSRRRVKADRGKVTQSVRLLATHRDAMAVASVRIVVP
jgi:hypothetical protein